MAAVILDEVAGKAPGFDFGPGFKAGGLSEDLFHRTQHELEQEVGHDELVPDIKETLFGLVFGEKAQRIRPGTLNTAVAIVVNQSGSGCPRAILCALKVKQVAEGVAQFVPVKAAQDGLPTSTACLCIGQGQCSGKRINHRLDLFASWLRLFFRGHFT